MNCWTISRNKLIFPTTLLKCSDQRYNTYRFSWEYFTRDQPWPGQLFRPSLGLISRTYGTTPMNEHHGVWAQYLCSEDISLPTRVTGSRSLVCTIGLSSVYRPTDGLSLMRLPKACWWDLKKVKTAVQVMAGVVWGFLIRGTNNEKAPPTESCLLLAINMLGPVDWLVLWREHVVQGGINPTNLRGHPHPS